MLQEKALTEESNFRSLLLLASGAIAGLALAGYGLFTAAGSTTNAIPEGAVALVNHRQILLSDYRNQLQTLYEVPLEKATAEQRRSVLDSMVAEELLVQRGLEIDLPATDASVREALVAGVELTSAADINAQKPSDEELKRYFDAHRDQHRTSGTMMLRDLVASIGPRESAEQAQRAAVLAVQALRRGIGVDKVRARFDVKEAAGEIAEDQLDIAVARKLGDKLFAVANALSPGEVSDPVVAADGVHVLMMQKRRRAAALEFAAARERVASDMKREAQVRAHEEYVRFCAAKRRS